MSRGVFFAFEGIDGVGKTSQALRLRDRLLERGLDALYTREPTEGPWGRRVREIAVRGRDGLAAEEELDWYIRDREEHVREVIAPGLEAGRVIITDRYFYSTAAYQGALGLEVRAIRELNKAFPAPDLVFLLDAPVERGRSRITSGRGENTNKAYEEAEYLARVKANFDAMTDANLRRIDADRPFEEAAAEVLALALETPPLQEPEESG